MQYPQYNKFPHLNVFEQILNSVQSLGQEQEVLGALSPFQVFSS